MRVEGLAVRAGDGALLTDVSFQVEPGELVALTGPSGSGKTVLARTLLGVLDASPGRVAGSVDPGGAAWLPQDGLRSLDPLLRVREVADRESLAAVGLSEAGDLYPHQLSGGMAKRVALARALSTRRPFLVADEPEAAVDADLRERLHQHLRTVADAGVGVLWITHDTAAARARADRCLALRDGRLVPFEPPDEPGPPAPTGSPGDVVLAVDAVRFAYRAWRKTSPVLHHAALTVRAGERVALLGPSGSGKSTLAQLIVGLRRPDAGTVLLRGEPPVPGRHSQLLTQDPRAMLVEDLPLDALLHRSARLHGRPPAAVAEALEAVGLSHRAGARPHELSGGELRRAGIARVRLARPSLLVADEPLAALDAPLRGAIARVLFDAVGPEGGLLFITHDMAFAERAAHRTIRMDAGRTA
ncbi:MAG: ABC transporter ATP-binding protein [Alphaproteobacteria bacterium]|nr:ABC transporter ATP-binding protein [Alphaproteobacteria bacterium]